MPRRLAALVAAPAAFAALQLGACGGSSDSGPGVTDDAGADDVRPRPPPDLDGSTDAGDLPAHQVISKTNRTFLEAETSLAMAADGTLVSVWIALYNSGSSDIGYAISKDLGATWTAPAFMGDPGTRESGDPVVAVDPDGNFWATWIAFRRSGADASDFVLYVAKLAKGGAAFGTPVAVDTFNSGDKPWIAVTQQKSIVVSYMKDVGAGGVLEVARSTDGTSWTFADAYAFPAGGFANFAVPCTSATSSRLWLTHLDTDSATGKWAHRLRWSDDDGVTWPSANVGTVVEPGVTGAPTLEPASCAANGSDVWVGFGAWTQAPLAQDTPADEYHVAHTTDGAAFTTVTASDGATKVMALGDLIAEGPGVLSATYYAGDQQNDFNGSVRRVRSTDSGKTWSASQPLGAGIRFTVDRSSATWLGDYLGTAAQNGVLYTTFGDNQSGSTTHISFAKIAAP
jgi:hypothetical protein